MPDWLYHLPVAWMALVICAGTALVAAVVYGAAMALAARGHAPMLKAISPVMLTPLAVLFGLIVAFICSQVWSDAQRANAAVAREASASATRSSMPVSVTTRCTGGEGHRTNRAPRACRIRRACIISSLTPEESMNVSPDKSKITLEPALRSSRAA